MTYLGLTLGFVVLVVLCSMWEANLYYRATGQRSNLIFDIFKRKRVCQICGVAADALYSEKWKACDKHAKKLDSISEE